MYSDCLHGAYIPPPNRWNEISWTCMAYLAHSYTGAYKVKAGKAVRLLPIAVATGTPTDTHK